jgi:membrane protease YdiL (CAAX protease family)
MSNSFLEAAKQGKNQWWRYLISIVLILFIVPIMGSIIFVIALGIGGFPLENIDSLFEGTETSSNAVSFPILSYIALYLPYFLFAVGIFITIKWIHERQFTSLIRFNKQILWQRIFQGFFLWTLLLALLYLYSYLTSPSSFQVNFNPTLWIPFLLFNIIATPVQTSVEELFFRGYLLQGLGLLVKNKFILILLNSLLFAVPHFFNPEMERSPVLMALYYLSVGIFLALITIKDNGLELALGVHAAHNFWISTFFTTKDSVLSTPAIFISEPGEPIWTLIFYLLKAGLFYYLIFGRKSKRRALN